MSIRPEEAAAEANRFSLRSAILGASERATFSGKPASPPLVQRVSAAPVRPAAVQHELNPMNSKLMMSAKASIQANAFTVAAGTPTAPPAPTRTIQTSGLTFGSITGSTQTPTAQQQQSAFTNQHALNTMKKLSELQKLSAFSQATATKPQVNATMASSASSQRILNAGYVNGGSAKGAPSAELMRLTALVDSLNAKISTQSERLQKTESSLIKANQALTSERAQFNARVSRVQADLKNSKQSEAKLRLYASQLDTASTQKNQQRSFEEAAKQAEEFDTKLSSYEAQICELKREKNSLAANLLSETAKAENVQATLSAEKAELAAQIKSEKDAVASTAAAAEANMIDVQKQLTAAEHERDSLSMQLESSKKETAAHIEELQLQHKGEIEKITQANENVDAIIKTRNRFEAELELSVQQLAEAKHELELVKASQSVSVPPDMIFFEENVDNCDALPTAMPTTQSVCAYKNVNAPNTFALPPRPNKMDAKLAANTAMLAELGTRRFIARAGPANTLFAPDFAAHTSIADAETDADATGVVAPAMDSKVSSLVKSVSMDITNACAHGRRMYLKAMEMPEEEIVKQMNDLMNEPVA